MCNLIKIVAKKRKDNAAENVTMIRKLALTKITH